MSGDRKVQSRELRNARQSGFRGNAALQSSHDRKGVVHFDRADVATLLNRFKSLRIPSYEFRGAFFRAVHSCVSSHFLRHRPPP